MKEILKNKSDKKSRNAQRISLKQAESEQIKREKSGRMMNVPGEKPGTQIFVKDGEDSEKAFNRFRENQLIAHSGKNYHLIGR